MQRVLLGSCAFAPLIILALAACGGADKPPLTPDDSTMVTVVVDAGTPSAVPTDTSTAAPPK